MSQDFMDPELIAEFIVDSKEHLETIEPNLLELEKTPGNLTILNEIFRPMHSLKGASGFLGLNRINTLAHRAENILDELRKGSMVVTSEIMDVILAATDALRQMIDSLESSDSEGDVEIGDLLTQIDSIMEQALNPPAVPVVEDVVLNAPAEQARMVQGIETVSSTMNASDWLNQLQRTEPYALTAFGEGHLKDFLDEAHEISENLSAGLLKLEQDRDPELVNNLFRYFHNLKGNSGIIGFQELNSLTHEAETLLNRVRHDEMLVTRELVDLLLLVVDVIDALVEQIDPPSGKVSPIDAHEVLDQLRIAVAGGAIELPAVLRVVEQPQSDISSVSADVEETLPEDMQAVDEVVLDAPAVFVEPAPVADISVETAVPAVEAKPEVLHTSEPAATAMPEEKPEAPEAPEASERVVLNITPVGGQTLDAEDDDIALFQSTVSQQQEIIRAAMEELGRDSSKKECIDALYRSLVAIQKSASFMEQKELSTYAATTAGLVGQARDKGIDFSLMLDLLQQEIAILKDMIGAGIVAMRAAQTAAVEEAAAAQIRAAEEAKEAEARAAAAKIAPPSVAAKPAPPQSAPAKSVALKPAQTTAAAKPTDAGAEHKTSSTIRVDHEKLDHLMNLIGELIINRNRYTMIARRLEDSNGQADIDAVAQDLSETTYAMARISDDLQDTIMKVRMVPVASVFSRFPRLVRDLSRKSGKEVELVLEGEETELDKSVVEVIGDPLVHLIRNAVDHGVENEDERLAKGKSAKGRVVLRAYHKGNSVAIEIEDDGKGLDPEKLREVAVRKGLMTMEEARQLDDREARELIFAPGFSSADKVTDISGRGVGMDVVRTNIKALKGSISITSEVGKGTRFTLSLPLTLAIIDALMVSVRGETYAIPLDAVSETTKIEAHRLTEVKGRKAVTLRGEVLGIVNFSEMLELPDKEEEPEVLSVVVIHDNDRRLGLVVDRLLERQEVVIKPLGSYLGDVRGISGATIIGDGSVILIVDPHEVYLMATSNSRVSNNM